MSPWPEIGKVSNRANYWQFHFGREGGVSKWANYWQFHFGEGGGFKLVKLLAVSFWGGRKGGTSAGRLVNFDSFSEIGYRSP